MPKLTRFFIILFLLPFKIFSQDLSGVWAGYIQTSETRMPFELVINQDYSGYSMIVFTFRGTENVAVKTMKLVRNDSLFTMSDDKLIYNNFTMKSRRVKAFCELSLKKEDTVLVLTGPLRTKSHDMRSLDNEMYAGNIFLKKQSNEAKTPLIHKLDSLQLSGTLSFSKPQPVIKEPELVVETPPKDLPQSVVKSHLWTGAAKSNAMAVNAPRNIVAGKKTVQWLVKFPVVVAAAPAIAATSNSTVAVVEKKPPPVAEEKKKVEPAPVTIVPKTTAPVVVAAKPPVIQKTDSIAKPEKTMAQSSVQNSTEKQKIPVAPPSITVSASTAGAATQIALRKTEVIRSIDFSSDSLVIILYDNGIVDGDTVSVVLNGNVIIPKQGLSEQAYRKVIKVGPEMGDSLQLVMYAENLGSIPPNTGLLILEDGANRQEIRFEGDMKKSSAVILRRKR